MLDERTTPTKFVSEEDEDAGHVSRSDAAVVKSLVVSDLADFKHNMILAMVAVTVGVLLAVWQITNSEVTSVKSDFREAVKDFRDDLRRDIERVEAVVQTHEARLRKLETRK